MKWLLYIKVVKEGLIKLKLKSKHGLREPKELSK